MSWPSVPIGDHVTIRGGGTPRRDNKAYFSGRIPWITPKDMKVWDIRDGAIRITEEAISSSATTLVPTNTVLLVVRSGILKHTVPIAINRVPVAINQDMKSLQCDDKLVPDYLARLLKAAEPTILGWVRATTADNFPIDRLRQLEIPLPPIDEQRKIAAILDQADDLCRKSARVLENLSELSRSIFFEMFGDPGRDARRWAMVKFSDLLAAPLRNGVSPSSRGTLSLKVLTLSSVTRMSFDENAVKTASFISSPPELQRVDGRDLLICRGNGNRDLVGRAFFPTRDMPSVVFPDTIIAARIDTTRAIPRFIEYLWNSEATRAQIERKARTTNGTFKVNQTMLEGIDLILPPIDLQSRYAERDGEIDRIRKVVNARLVDLESLFATLQSEASRGETPRAMSPDLALASQR